MNTKVSAIAIERMTPALPIDLESLDLEFETDIDELPHPRVTTVTVMPVPDPAFSFLLDSGSSAGMTTRDVLRRALKVEGKGWGWRFLRGSSM